MAVLRCWRPLGKCALYSKNKGLKSRQIRIWSDVSVQIAPNGSHSFNCILVRMLLFFLFSIKVIYVEHLSRRETKTPVVSQLRGTALSSRWSTTTVCAFCLWAVWQPFSCLVDWSSRTNKMAAMWLLFALGPRTNSPIRAKAHTWWNGAANSSYICHCPAGLEGKCWVCSFQVAGVCRMLGSLLKCCTKW